MSSRKSTSVRLSFNGNCPICRAYFTDVGQHLKLSHDWTDDEVKQVEAIPQLEWESTEDLSKFQSREVSWEEIERKQDGRWEIESSVSELFIRLDKKIDEAYVELQRLMVPIFIRSELPVDDQIDGPRKELNAVVETVLDFSRKRVGKQLSREIFQLVEELKCDIGLL